MSNYNEGTLQCPLKYNNLPSYGNYIFYYDFATGKLKYTFKYNRTPRHGGYIFNYPTQDIICVEKEILGSNVNRTTDIGNIQLYTINRCHNTTSDSPDNFFEKLSKVEDMKIVHSTIGFFNNKNRDKILIFEDGMGVNVQKEHILNIQDKTAGELSKIQMIDIVVPTILSSKITDIKTSISEDNLLCDLFERKVLVEDIASTLKNDIQGDVQETSGLKIKDRDIEVEKEIKLQLIDRQLEIEKDIGLDRLKYNLEIEQDIDLNRLRHFVNIERETRIKREDCTINIEDVNNRVQRRSFGIDSIEYKKHINNKNKKIYSGSDVEPSVKNNKNITDVDNKIIGANKFQKSVAKHNKEEFSKELYDYAQEYGEEEFSKNDKNISQIEKDIQTNDFYKHIYKEDKEYLGKLFNKKSQLDKDYLFSEVGKNIDEEIEERLNLHKRFWFLDNVGKMDIKILPNVDAQYPPRIELFDEIVELKEYMYKYSDNFKEIGGKYEVRLYKSYLEKIELVAIHTVDGIQDYKVDIDNIQIGMSVINSHVDDYPYKVDFNIDIDDTEFDYMIIEQPKGEKTNKFVFVASEKFLSENHPIPLGEDMGTIEFPISIGIMVDFVNILLLIWSKMYHSYSGCTGTQAISNMTELVYEWLTLETSLNVESIEAYNRCYRWLRWECEKVYNKAKFDPHLNGNNWVEEVIAEMIDYMEMHHFNKVPEWDDIERMDEQRNGIFQDVNLDIPIVVDKFKGIRKRVAKKHKRFRDY